MAPEEHPEPDLPLHPGQLGTETVVPARREQEVVAGVGPGDVDARRVGEDPGVAVRAGEDGEEREGRARCERDQTAAARGPPAKQAHRQLPFTR